MATQPTQDSVPSESPRNLKFNAGKIDEFVTSLALQYVDRFGNAHYTIEGLKSLVLQQIYNLGWNPVGTFQGGASITAAGDVIQDETNDVWYRWDDLSTIPKTVPAGSTPGSTGGIGDGKWIAVDISDVLRKDLASSSGSSLVGHEDTTVELKLNDLADKANQSLYLAKNVRFLGVANNLLRSGGTLKIVCVGDSITAGQDTVSSDKITAPSGNPQTIAPIQYPSRLETRLNFFTPASVSVINRGWSGDTVMRSWTRWTTNPNANVCHLMLGINDAAGVDGETFEQYCDYYERLIRRYIDWGCGVVVHTATPQQFGQNDGGQRYTEYVRSLAKAYGCPVFDSDSVIQYCTYNSVYSDSVHFNKAGYAKYGDAVASFILSGGWVRPFKGVSSFSAQQPGRSSDGIGWYGKGTSQSMNLTGSFVLNGQTGTIPASSGAVSSFSFYLDCESANVFMVGYLEGGTISMAQPETTVDGYAAINRIQPKHMSSEIRETVNYIAPSRPTSEAKKSWVGSLVGRGWKTVYVQNSGANALNLCYLVIEPCDHEDVFQTNAGLTRGVKEVLLYKQPTVGRANSGAVLATAAQMPAQVDIPFPRGLYRQAQQWNHVWDSFTFEAKLKTNGASDTTLNGVSKILALPRADGFFDLFYPFQSQATLLKPTSVQVVWSDPNATTETKTAGFPTMNRARVYLRFNFPTTGANVAAYYTLEVECNGSNAGYGAWMD